MADTAAPSDRLTEAPPAAPTLARTALATVDDKILTLLANRLAHALLLDAKADIAPSAAHTRVDSVERDTHS